jgi:cellulose synthase/poly-beta-1,6-N-acetylglucosamine synthase-like glycosyltransferase
MPDSSHSTSCPQGQECLPLQILSVIIPIYNEAYTVADVIRIVLEQSQVAEVIVVDGGS